MRRWSVFKDPAMILAGAVILTAQVFQPDPSVFIMFLGLAMMATGMITGLGSWLSLPVTLRIPDPPEPSPLPGRMLQAPVTMACRVDAAEFTDGIGKARDLLGKLDRTRSCGYCEAEVTGPRCGNCGAPQ